MSQKVINVFKNSDFRMDSNAQYYHSDQVLSILEPGLCSIGFSVEKSKHKQDKINVPVLFGLNGKIEKAFDADAYSSEYRYVIE